MDRFLISVDQLHVYNWLSIPMWVFDRSRLRITWANPSALEFWAANSIEELARRDFSDITPTAMDRLNAVHRNALKGINVEEQWTLYPRGQPRQVVLKSAVVREKDNSTEGILFCAANLRAVPDAQLRGVQVLSYTSTVAALYTLAGDVLFRNPVASAIWDGLSNDRDTDALSATFANPQDAGRIIRAVSGKERIFGEFNVLTAKQGERIFELDCRPVIDPIDAQLVLGMSGRDITDYKRVEAERNTLREAQLRAAQAVANSEKELTVAARKIFMATASHELRSPLQSIMSSLDLLERYPHEIENCVMPMREATQQLNDIALGLVEFVRADSAPGLRIRALHAATFFRKTLAPIRRQALAKGLEFSFSPEGLDVTIAIDEIRMRQIIVNLAENAVKYTEAGAVQIHAAIEPEKDLALRVKDTGIGMSKAATRRVLQPFARGSKSHLLNPQGLGLGLAIVQSHLLEMGGEMDIRSELQAGTEISIRLPLQNASAFADSGPT
ncbi:PAS domain-containing sensor histidine kinase [Herbaspirillum sp. SJZ099]|uniref:PAS domain-containing sensor histidine kinase n=1 Tax=Herbaspirillum sp. SJZ099 TaxID=2572916 RepID=UPI0011A711AE|nr:PAS domain-containing sensor histidine kinase [Herbaspirillum sp. SJZ099]TWC65066.1 signal transduction histidine kinase [Herbaspirillum sp. SJZ099]